MKPEMFVDDILKKAKGQRPNIVCTARVYGIPETMKALERFLIDTAGHPLMLESMERHGDSFVDYEEYPFPRKEEAQCHT